MHLALALLAGLGLGVACKSGGGSNSPTSVEGSASCPRSVPRNGASCPRGETDFCVYRAPAGDHVCSCGKGNWRCAKK
jgi:hypothetical protein